MKYGIASLVAVLLLLAGIALAGAGHGWMAGAIGCFLLAPVLFLAVANGLGGAPSFRRAVVLLVGVLALGLGVAMATAREGSQYLDRFLQATGNTGLATASAAYFGALLIATLAAARAWPGPRRRR